MARTYVVRPGDSYFTIASKVLGNPGLAGSLMAANPNINVLATGVVLTIPDASPAFSTSAVAGPAGPTGGLTGPGEFPTKPPSPPPPTPDLPGIIVPQPSAPPAPPAGAPRGQPAGLPGVPVQTGTGPRGQPVGLPGVPVQPFTPQAPVQQQPIFQAAAPFFEFLSNLGRRAGATAIRQTEPQPAPLDFGTFIQPLAELGRRTGTTALRGRTGEGPRTEFPLAPVAGGLTELGRRAGTVALRGQVPDSTATRIPGVATTPAQLTDRTGFERALTGGRSPVFPAGVIDPNTGEEITASPGARARIRYAMGYPMSDLWIQRLIQLGFLEPNQPPQNLGFGANTGFYPRVGRGGGQRVPRGFPGGFRGGGERREFVRGFGLVNWRI